MERRGVISLVATTDYAPQIDYSIRRAAADLGVPLILNHQLAYMLAKSLLKVSPKQLKPLELRDYWCRGGIT